MTLTIETVDAHTAVCQGRLPQPQPPQPAKRTSIKHHLDILIKARVPGGVPDLATRRSLAKQTGIHLYTVSRWFTNYKHDAVITGKTWKPTADQLKILKAAVDPNGGLPSTKLQDQMCKDFGMDAVRIKSWFFNERTARANKAAAAATDDSTLDTTTRTAIELGLEGKYKHSAASIAAIAKNFSVSYDVVRGIYVVKMQQRQRVKLENFPPLKAFENLRSRWAFTSSRDVESIGSKHLPIDMVTVIQSALHNDGKLITTT
jgi:hypothetical protein